MADRWSETEERIAQVIDPEAFGLPPHDLGEYGMSDRDEARLKARTVISAMRKPTEAMAERVAKRLGDTFIPDNLYVLRDLLIHALAIANGPMTAEQRLWQEQTIDKWLVAFAEGVIDAVLGELG